MMSIAPPALVSTVSEVLKLIHVEDVLVVSVLALLILSRLKVLSTKSRQSPKLEQGDVPLTRSAIHELRQRGFQHACREEPAPKSQHMASHLSGSSGEEPAKMKTRKGNQRFRYQQNELSRKLRRDATGDPIKDALVTMIRSFQVRTKFSQEEDMWDAVCVSQGGNRDPVKYPVEVLQQFVQDHCSSEDRSMAEYVLQTPARELVEERKLQKEKRIMAEQRKLQKVSTVQHE